MTESTRQPVSERLDLDSENRPGFRIKADRMRIVELFTIIVASAIVFLFSSANDILENIAEVARRHENWELDEIIPTSLFLLVAMAVYSMRRWREIKAAERRLERRNTELEKAIGEIRQLRGIIPICSICKKVRNDGGYWEQVETYIRDHSNAEFTHGICPDCMEKCYPEFLEEIGGVDGKSD